MHTPLKRLARFLLLVVAASSAVATAVTTASAQTTDFPFTIPDDIKSQPVLVTVHLDQARPINPDFFGFNTQLLVQTYKLDSPALAEATADLAPGHLRFPSNRSANFYNWVADRPVVPDTPAYDQIAMFQEIRKLSQIMQERDLKSDYPGFATLAKATGATPLLVVGLNANTPKDIVNWIADVKSRGLPTPRLELGYQAYLRGITSPDTETARDYLTLAKAVADAVRAAHPDARMAVNVAPQSPSTKTWNTALAVEDFFDAATHQFYVGGYTRDDIVEIGPKEVLTAEKYVDQLAENHTRLLPNKKVWLSEWGLNSPTRQRYPHNGASGLMLAAVATRLLERSDVFELATYTQFAARQAVFDISVKGNRVIYGDYLTLRLINRVAKAGQQQVPLTITPAASDALPMQPVIAAAIRNGDQLRLLVVNRLPIPRTITFAGLGDSPAISATSLGLVSLLRSATPTSEANAYTRRSGQSAAEVPGYSVSVLEISIKP